MPDSQADILLMQDVMSVYGSVAIRGRIAETEIGATVFRA